MSREQNSATTSPGASSWHGHPARESQEHPAPGEVVHHGRDAHATLWRRAAEVFEAIKFAHTLFALPFAALAAVWAAGGWPPPAEVALLGVCMVAARTAAMAFNRVVDARFDAVNPRTCNRAIPAGRLTARSLAALAAGSAAVFVAAAAAFWPLAGNPWPALLAVPFLLVLLGYSYAKRFTLWSHLWLGVALGLSPVGVWIALTGHVAWVPVLLGAAVASWTAGFDILYALADMAPDRELGLHSVPARYGAAAALWIARGCHAAMILLLVALVLLVRTGTIAAGGAQAGPWSVGGLVLLAALLAWEHALVRADDLSRLGQAFFTVNACGSVAFCTLAIVDLVV